MRAKNRRIVRRALKSHAATLRRIDKPDEPIMSFGIYKGQRISDVPPDYLIWLFENDKCFGEILKYIYRNERSLREEIVRKSNGSH